MICGIEARFTESLRDIIKDGASAEQWNRHLRIIESCLMIKRIAEDPQPNQIHPEVLPKVCIAETKLLSRCWAYFWALPTTSVALPILLINVLMGGRTIYWHGLIESQGPFVKWFLSRGPVPAAAMTLGHVILCMDENARQRFRSHELVHVQQAEAWGPLFLPGYLWIFFVVWRRTGNGYWNHPWEVQAREKSGI